MLSEIESVKSYFLYVPDSLSEVNTYKFIGPYLYLMTGLNVTFCRHSCRIMPNRSDKMLRVDNFTRRQTGALIASKMADLS